MSEHGGVTGRCLCGAVEIRVATVSPSVGACHCGMCRRWSGGPLLAVDCGTEVTVEGEGHVSVFDSSRWAERGFCVRCGTHLFYRIKHSGQHIVPVGLLDGDPGYALDHQVFIDDKPGYYAFEGETRDMTGEEVFAMFAPPGA